MYCDLVRFPLLGMSESELLPGTEDLKEISPPPTSKKSEVKEDTQRAAAEREEISTATTVTVPPPNLGESEVAEDDDGFRTPTSSDQKIPAVKECPPAPRKRTNSSAKRKAGSSPPARVRRSIQLDLSEEVESMFPPSVREEMGRKIKRTRRDDDTG